MVEAQLIRLPSLSAGMETGSLVRWLKGPGDAIEEGEVIAEIETDKATMELQADRPGIVGEICVPEGADVPVGEIIAKLIEGRDHVCGSPGHATAPVPVSKTQPGRERTFPEPRTADSPPPVDVATPRRRRNASPLARRLARERGIELAMLAGSGPGGRVLRADVETTEVGGNGSAELEERGSPHRSRQNGATSSTLCMSAVAKFLPLTKLRAELSASIGDGISIEAMLLRAATRALEAAGATGQIALHGDQEDGSALTVDCRTLSIRRLTVVVRSSPSSKRWSLRCADPGFPQLLLENLRKEGPADAMVTTASAGSIHLLVSAAEDRVLAENGEIGIHRMVKCSTVADASVFSDPDVLSILREFVRSIEAPLTMLV